jgi:energy-converting hydrogenase Eha subunit A
MTENAHSRLTILARAVVLVIGLGCAAQLLRVPDWREDYPPLAWLGLSAIFTTAALALGYVALRLPWPVMKRVALELAAMGAVLVLVEAAIAFYRPPPDDRHAERVRVASRLGIEFDARSRSEVVAALRRDGVDAYPGTGSNWPLVPLVRRQLPEGFYPFAHASNVTVVECNESGTFLTYQTDEWGFNNPQGLISAGGVDLALVGESYALGHCLPRPLSLAGRMRDRFPRTANFGMAGTNTLHALGIFREYVEPLRPRVVLWTVNPHFVTADEVLDHPVLSQYLDPDFSQQLARRQPETDRLVREIAIPAQAELDAIAAEKSRESKRARILGAWRLPEVQARVRTAILAGPALQGWTELATFRQTLDLANQATRGWGGRLVVVLLPIYAEVVAKQLPPDRRHENLARIVTDLGIPVVDGAELYSEVADPAALFTMRINNHPTADGYALLAGEVAGRIEALVPGLQGRGE